MKFKEVLVGLAIMICISLYTHSVILTLLMSLMLIGMVALAKEEHESKRYGFPDIDAGDIRYGANPDYISYNRDEDYLDEA